MRFTTDLHCLKRILITCAFGLACVGSASASVILGSSLTSRTLVDAASGRVFIYAGGSFDAGATIDTFSFVLDQQAVNRFLTPLLFEQTSAGAFALRGVGAGHTVSAASGAQSFGFDLQQGVNVAANAGYTFGFINALLDNAGIVSASSSGAVDFNLTVDPGTGVGGVGTTNDWVFTPFGTAFTALALGTVFYTPGHVGDLALNDPSLGAGGGNTNRTYAASMSTVPEPASLALVGLGLAGIGFSRRKPA